MALKINMRTLTFECWIKAKTWEAIAALSRRLTRICIRWRLGNPLSSKSNLSESARASQYTLELQMDDQNHLLKRKSTHKIYLRETSSAIANDSAKRR